MSAFVYFPRNRPLTPSEQKCLDELSRQMAEVMIQRQDQHRFFERLIKEQKSCDSGYGNLVPNPFYNPSFTASTTSSTALNLVANPFYDPEYVRGKLPSKST
ncbi:unnamed protein product [Caenorhabditis brenneri]